MPDLVDQVPAAGTVLASAPAAGAVGAAAAEASGASEPPGAEMLLRPHTSGARRDPPR